MSKRHRAVASQEASDGAARVPSLALIAEIAGEECAARIEEKKGGAIVYIPTVATLHDDHWLPQTVGMETAREIADRLGGATIAVPAGSVRRRREAIEKALAEGKSVGKIATELGVGRSTVQRHKNVMSQKPRRSHHFSPPAA